VATPDVRWTIHHSLLGGSITVTAFRTRALAVEHLEKHYLNPVERWEAINGGRPVLSHKPRLAQLAGDVQRGVRTAAAELAALQDKLVDDYVATVQKATGTRGSVILGCLCQHRPHPMAPQVPRVCVASNLGVFAAFDRSESLSELCTAMRPLNRGLHAPPSPRDYVLGAIQKVALAEMRGSRPRNRNHGSAGRGGMNGKHHVFH